MHYTRRIVYSYRDNNKYEKYSIVSKRLVLKTCRKKMFTVEPDRTADIQRSYTQTLNLDVSKQKRNIVHSRQTEYYRVLHRY